MASRKEQKEALRKERLEREQAAAQSAARKRLIGIVVAGILLVGIVAAVGVVLLTGDDDGSGGGGDGATLSFPDAAEIPDPQETDLSAAVEASGCTTERVRAQGAGEHTTEPVEYESEPPALGPHYPEWPEDDIFETAPPIERLVHTLEHGRILVWVRPDAPRDLLAQIRALYEEDPYHVIVTPREELEEPIAVSAWVGQDTGHILRCPRPNDRTWDAIRAFKNEYRDKAPEFVP